MLPVGILGFGILIGYFASTPVLWTLTAIAALLVLYMSMKFREMAVLITISVGISLGIAVLAMWITHYLATNQTWFGEALKPLLR